MVPAWSQYAANMVALVTYKAFMSYLTVARRQSKEMFEGRSPFRKRFGNQLSLVRENIGRDAPPENSKGRVKNLQ